MSPSNYLKPLREEWTSVEEKSDQSNSDEKIPQEDVMGSAVEECLMCIENGDDPRKAVIAVIRENNLRHCQKEIWEIVQERIEDE